MSRGISRRHFFFGTLLAGVVPRGGFGSVASLKALGYQSPNEKMSIAAVGAGGRALSVLASLDSENIVAMADVDWVRGAEGFKLWPQATKYKDYRQLLDKEKSIDAVTVVIPDHMHANVALAAMQRGKHVYVEKPLTRTPWEARVLTDAAAKYKVATQMGNQGYSHDATRVAAEIIWSGEIGDVTEVHSFRGRASWPQGMPTLPAPEKVPDTLDWDLWLGNAAMRPYTSGDDAYRKEYDQQFGFYLPFNWRGFYDFGSSLIGDWGIHQLGPANLALRLGSPTSVECLKQGEGRSPYTFPRGGVVIKWEFAARGTMPPVTVYWSDTGDMYTPAGMTVDEMRAIPGTGPQIESAGGGGRGGRGPGAGARGAAPGDAPPRAPVVAGDPAAVNSREAATTPCSSDQRGILGRAAAAKASACCRARAGPRIHCRRACSPAHRGISATGSAPARAASRRARTSASPGPTPNGWCLAPSPRASKASCCGTQRRWSSRTTGKQTST